MRKLTAEELAALEPAPKGAPIKVHMVDIQSRRVRITSGERPWVSQQVWVRILVSGGALGRRKRWHVVAQESVQELGGEIMHGIHVQNWVSYTERNRLAKPARERRRKRR